jgi:hypothetical protein
LDETQSHLCAAYDRKYIDKDQFAKLYREGTEIRKLTVGHHSAAKWCDQPRGGR